MEGKSEIRAARDRVEIPQLRELDFDLIDVLSVPNGTTLPPVPSRAAGSPRRPRDCVNLKLVREKS